MSFLEAEGELVGVFLESLLYGIYFPVFLQCMQVLQKRQDRPNDYLLGTAVSLFLLATLHLVIDIIRGVDAFTSDMGTPNYPVKFYQTYGSWWDITKNMVYVAVTIISDAFILYRCFVVWSQNYLVVVTPFLLFLADIAIGVLWVYTLSITSPGANIFKNALSVRVNAFYSVTLGMNIICTCLIAFRIWKMQRCVVPFVEWSHGQGEFSRVVAIVVESGAVYSAILTVMIATCVDSSPVMFIFLDLLCPIIGIVFSSIIIRVGQGLSHEDSYNAQSMQWIVRPNETQTALSGQQTTCPGECVQNA